MAKKASRSPYNTTEGLTESEIETGEELIAYQGEGRPQTRADCINGPRPCAYVRCRYNLYLDVRRLGAGKSTAIRINFPELEGPHEMTHSCALDTADRHPDGMLLSAMGERLNVCLERARQLEARALKKLKKKTQYQRVYLPLWEAWETARDRPDDPGPQFHRSR